MQPTICFVASKSGGHIIPCITLAHTIKQQNPATQIIFFTGNTPLDQICTQQQSCIDKSISLPCTNIKTKGIGLGKMWQLGRAFFISFYYLYKFRPTTIISTGGLIAVPVCVAAFLLRIPFKLYELNALPGKAIQFLAPYAQSTVICFQQTAHYLATKNYQLGPYPLRFSLADKAAITTVQARHALSLAEHKPTLAILGGSQGSHFLNRLITSYNPDLLPSLQFIHQTGSTDTVDWQQWYRDHQLSAYVCAFDTHPERIYSAADIIICRSGSGILHEIIFFGKKCITIPLPEKVTDHQLFNARACAQQYPEYIYYLSQEQVEQNPALLWQQIMFLLQAKQ